MRIDSTSPPLARLLAGALVTLVAACGEQPEPLALARQTAPLSDSRPHYLYQGEPVYLDVDPTRLTVSGGATEAALRASLAAAGLGSSRLERVPFAPESFTVHLDKGGSPAEGLRAAAALRREGRYDFVANVYRWAEDGSEVVLHNRLVVRFKAGVGAEAAERLARELDARVLHTPQGGSEEYVLSYPRGVEPLDFALALGRRPEVEWVDPDKTAGRRPHAIPTDPFFANQYYARSALTFNGVRVDDNVEWAWDLTYGAWSAAAGPFRVAVIDDGVETSHPELSNSWLGYDAYTNTWSSWGCTDCATNPFGTDNHGTAVAGIIASQHNNGLGLAGLAPAVQLLPVRIFRGYNASTNRYDWVASDWQIAMGIDAAWQNGAQVINNSWGGGSPSSAITAAIGRATTQGRGGKGTVMVFSAGNTSRRAMGIIGGVLYPATLSNVLAVGAINRNGGLTDYTPEGSALDIVAPSGHTTGRCTGDVVTVDPLGWDGCNDGPGGNIDYTSTFSGTSAAAPQVAAVAAMVLSRSATLTEAQVRSQLTTNADPWGSSTQVGSGKLNAYRALVGRTRVTISGSTFPSMPGSYTYTANASGGVGGYSYNWEISYDGGGYYYYLSSSSSVSVWVDYNANFTLRVTVTNGPDSQRATASRSIRGPESCSTNPARQGSGTRVPSCPLPLSVRVSEDS